MAQSILDLVGDKIVRSRKKLGLSQEELAKQMGKTRQALSAWEKGTKQIPLLELERLAMILGESMQYFFTEEFGNAPAAKAFQQLDSAFQKYIEDTIRQVGFVQDRLIPPILIGNDNYYWSDHNTPTIDEKRFQAEAKFQIVYDLGNSQYMIKVVTLFELTEGHFVNPGTLTDNSPKRA